MPLRLVLVLAVAVAGGCSTKNSGGPGPDLGDGSGTGGNGGAGGAGGGGSGGSGGGGGDGGGVTTSCTGKTAPAMADDTWTIPSGGLMRSARVHVPASYDPAKGTPLIVNFHGYTSNGQQEDFLSQMSAKSDAAGFIAIYPEGTGASPSWNAGACCGEAAMNGTDDIGFVKAILDTAADKLCIDAKRIFATGMSNGGFLSHRIGCELADRFAAVAPVAGVLGVATCTPSRPMPIIHFHGTMDTLVPYDGSASMGFASVADTFAGWGTRNKCTDQPSETFRMADAHCSSYLACAGGAQVTLCTVDNGGHTWPGGTPIPGLGYTTTNISATDAMWSFFQAHPLP
jgi:polyhydroxybutyrate depolymerase